MERAKEGKSGMSNNPIEDPRTQKAEREVDLEAISHKRHVGNPSQEDWNVIQIDKEASKKHVCNHNDGSQRQTDPDVATRHKQKKKLRGRGHERNRVSRITGAEGKEMSI